MNRIINHLAILLFSIVVFLLFSLSFESNAYANDRVVDLSKKNSKYNYNRDHMNYSSKKVTLKNSNGNNYYQLKWKSNGGKKVTLKIHNYNKGELTYRLDKYVNGKWERVWDKPVNSYLCKGTYCEVVFKDDRPKVGQVYAINFYWAKGNVSFKFDVAQNIYDSPQSKGYKLQLMKKNKITQAVITNKAGVEQRFEGWYRCEFAEVNANKIANDILNTRSLIKDCGHGHVNSNKKAMKIIDIPERPKKEQKRIKVSIKFVGKIGNKDGKRLYINDKKYTKLIIKTPQNKNDNPNGDKKNKKTKQNKGNNDSNENKDDNKNNDATKPKNIELTGQQYINEAGELVVQATPNQKKLKGNWQVSAGNIKKQVEQRTEAIFTFSKSNLEANNGIIPLKVTFQGKNDKKPVEGEWERNIVWIHTEQEQSLDKQKVNLKASLLHVKQAKGTWKFTINGKTDELKDKGKDVTLSLDSPYQDQLIEITFSGNVNKKKVTGASIVQLRHQDPSSEDQAGNDEQSQNDKQDGNNQNNKQDDIHQQSQNDQQDENDKQNVINQQDDNDEQGENNEQERKDEPDNDEQSDNDQQNEQNENEEQVNQSQLNNNQSKNIVVGGTLPKTATPYATISLAGILFIIIGFVILRFKQHV